MSADASPRRRAVALLAGLAVACGVPTPTGTTGIDDDPAARDRVDIHVHLVGGAVDELLAALDRRAIAAAVVIASPHLDPARGPAPGDDARLHGWREANDDLLAATADHRDRLFPFVAVEPAEVDIAELERWFHRGARGVKLYFGHQKLHARPLDDPAHASLFEWLEQRSVPVLAHVNTVRYRDELARVLRAHPRLELVCAHLCGSRTDLDRLAGLLREFPRLRVDTSHGAGLPGVDGFTAIEEDRDRLRALIEVQPERFLFGSDLVTARGPAGDVDWDLQLAANLGLLERERFEFWRHAARIGALTPGVYHGLALAEPAVSRVLGGNARAWLGAYRPQ
ncbi:amidohydrolase family protein [Nannocystis punicea]|uniref:Amidohydrolase family protein n=1 Tax=Nannocystis punicea TaxID=2995304 RepID=A0ABY7HFJ8_9BACT|nr:amidohydrolase family protein [Nannocystis poenicansa]WAS97850.1 amidohydrolase family protein [Nannocystis poenicansa]